MSVWIFQDALGTDLATKMQNFPEDTHTWWHVDCYFSESASPRIEVGDKVLLWQWHLDATAPAGVYAVAQIIGNPYWPTDEESKWRRIDILITKVLSKPLAPEEIRETGDPDLLAMLIMRMPAGHIVFPVRSTAWEALKRLDRELAI
jgi:predicted RNA-binding protein with PUA-like domain